MSMSSGFMCYIKQGDVQKGTICSLYTHNVWNEDLTSRNIRLEFDIASDLSMQYLAFAISANNYEWEVLHVRSKADMTPSEITIPEGYSGSVKFGIKLYDNPPTVGSILHVGFDYVVTGGIDVAVLNFDLLVYNEDGSQVCDFPSLSTSSVEVYGDIKSSKLILKVSSIGGITIDFANIYISDTTSNFQNLTITPTTDTEGYVTIPDSLVGKSPLYLSDNSNRYGEFVNNISSSSGDSDYSVGDTVTLDGIECIVVYDAGSEQSWGRYLLVDKNHDLSYYFSGDDYDEKQLPINDAKYGYEWGGRGVNTGTGATSQEIGNGLRNTNTILALNLQSETSGWPVLWDRVKEFRESHSNKWFVPTRTEMIQVIGRKYEELENFTVNTSANYHTSSEYNDNSAWIQYASDGGQSAVSKSSHECRVRLCCYMSDPNAPSKTTINITCGTSDATIRYTVDGSEPSESSTLYEGEFEVEAPATVKARGFKSGLLASDVASYEVEAPVQKLPTPRCYIRQESSLRPTYTLVVENYSEYPPNSDFHYTDSTGIVLRDNLYEENRLLGNINSTTVYISCEGYEDSDAVTATLQN